MSRIYFHSPEATAAVRGSERAYMGSHIADLFNATLDIPRFFEKDATFFKLIPQGCYLQDSIESLDLSNWLRFIESLEIWIRSLASDHYFVAGSYKIDIFGLQLNTAYLAGSDPIKLMARLHAQCEIHCYIEGQNREWLAGIIERGLKSAIYRRNQGWESVIELLRNGFNTPVVTSYSVCDSFPNPSIANFEPQLNEYDDPEWDAWYELDSAEQWNQAMQGLKQKGWLELNPESWNDYYFSHGWDAFKLNELLTIPQDRWNQIVKTFSETKLPASEAWTVALQLDR